MGKTAIEFPGRTGPKSPKQSFFLREKMGCSTAVDYFPGKKHFALLQPVFSARKNALQYCYRFFPLGKMVCSTVIGFFLRKKHFAVLLTVFLAGKNALQHCNRFFPQGKMLCSTVTGFFLGEKTLFRRFWFYKCRHDRDLEKFLPAKDAKKGGEFLTADELGEYGSWMKKLHRKGS